MKNPSPKARVCEVSLKKNYFKSSKKILGPKKSYRSSQRSAGSRPAKNRELLREVKKAQSAFTSVFFPSNPFRNLSYSDFLVRKYLDLTKTRGDKDMIHLDHPIPQFKVRMFTVL